jgi:hypothetical protein
LRKGEKLLNLDNAWCYSDQANAILITSAEHSKARCELESELKLLKEGAKRELETSLLKAHIKSLNTSHLQIVEALKAENDSITKIALDRPSDMRMWFAAGGFVAGITTTVLIGWLITSAQSGL